MGAQDIRAASEEARKEGVLLPVGDDDISAALLCLPRPRGYLFNRPVSAAEMPLLPQNVAGTNMVMGG